MNVIYLHGFASSPTGSSKVNAFVTRFASLGIDLRVPDLNQPDFEHLTLTAMIERTMDEVAVCPPGPILLIGSSMGGAVAVHTVDQLRRRGSPDAGRIAAILLMAPGLSFADNRLRQLGETGLRQWRESGWLTVAHFGYGESRRIHYGIMDDVARYDSYALDLPMPITIVHGTRDEVVRVEDSARFAEGRPNVTLIPVDSDHGLLDQIDVIFAEAQALLRAISPGESA
ncbi:MAG: alpha/beta fold hydrolase [Chloroflexi bacterium]|nr:alpha/beta fold hydrolase [Chloroflexota bacterium]